MKMDNEIIIASGNKGKIKEAQDILAEYKILPIKERTKVDRKSIAMDKRWC